MSNRRCLDHHASACHSRSSMFFIGQSLQHARPAVQRSVCGHALVPVNVVSKARTGSQQSADAVTSGGRRRSTVFLDSSDPVAGKQVKVRKAADNAPKKIDDEAILVITSNVTAFRQSRNSSRTRLPAKPHASNQVTLLNQHMSSSWALTNGQTKEARQGRYVY